MYLDVLEKISQGVNKPTNIMYKCNLSWRPLQEILRSLTEKGLIIETKRYNHRYYEVTGKGKKILVYLRKVIQMLHPAGSEAAVLSSSKPELLIAMQQDLDSIPILPLRKYGKKEDS